MSGRIDGDPRAIERDIGRLRDEIDEVVGELDRRRKEALDVRSQVRRHPGVAIAVGVGLAAVVGGAVALSIQASRRRERPGYKARQLRVAFDRMMRHPERVARGEPPPGEKILAAVGTAVATLLVKRAFERALPRPAVQPPAPPPAARRA